MNKFLLAATAALMAVGTTAPVAAAVNARQLNQQRLIDAGERSGKLTPREVARLRAEQRAIERKQAQLKAHGGYSVRDQRIIHGLQDTAERHIRMAKQNGHRAPSKKVLGTRNGGEVVSSDNF